MEVAGDVVWEHRFTADDTLLANPDRGFYRYTATALGPHGRHVPLDEAALVADRKDRRITVVFRYYWLDAYRRQAVIDGQDLERLTRDLETARRAGVSLVVRFAYSETSGRDAAVGRVVGHISQLVPIVNAHADVVLALQAGFVGRWGEWYFTQHFASSRRRPWIVSPADTRRRAQVLEALLDAAPDLLLQVRYPSIVRNLIPGIDDRVRRIGVHNDGFLASADDLGTYRAPDDREWLEAQSARAPMGGETCAVAPPRSEWPTAREELERFHWTYLNADFETAVLQSWGPDGLEEVEARLGYRLRLTSARVRSEPDGRSMAVDLELVNDGYAAPVRPWQVRLAVAQGDATEEVVLAVDPRTWAPGAGVHVAGRVPVAEGPPCDIGLVIDDGRRSVDGAAPATGVRAIRLANRDGWDGARAWNRIATSIRPS